MIKHLPPSKFGLVQITRQRVRPETLKLEKKIQTM
jgi:Ribonuclease G/E